MNVKIKATNIGFFIAVDTDVAKAALKDPDAMGGLGSFLKVLQSMSAPKVPSEEEDHERVSPLGEHTEVQAEAEAEVQAHSDAHSDDHLILATLGRDGFVRLLAATDITKPFEPLDFEREAMVLMRQFLNDIESFNFQAAFHSVDAMSKDYPMTVGWQLLQRQIQNNLLSEDAPPGPEVRDACLTEIKEYLARDITTFSAGFGKNYRPQWVSQYLDWCHTEGATAYASAFAGFSSMVKDAMHGENNWLTICQHMQAVMAACGIQSEWSMR